MWEIIIVIVTYYYLQQLDDREDGQGPGESRKGVECIDYRFYPMRDYTDMPDCLIKGLEIAKLDYFLVIGRPTMAPGAGLRGYKEVTTKKERMLAPCIVVYDRPGMLDNFEDDEYSWIEMPLGDSFMLDVTNMKTKDDYKTVLSKKGKQNYKTKLKKFDQEKNVEYELVDWVGTTENIDRIWPLYAATGEKNGFTVLTKEDFYKYHRSVPNQKVAYIWDVSDGPDNKKLVSFNTAFVWKDILHPMWCGTDHDNPLNRSCSTYFIILYNYAIEQPNINWIDLGASQRKTKTSIGYKPQPCSAYFRCKNSFMQMVVEYLMEKYYDVEKCITDP